MKLPKAIVGIDPGTTSAVAVISLKGKLIALESRRNFGKDEMIKFISSVCFPSMVATDRALPPSVVVKISSSFNSSLFVPEEDLKHGEKSELVKGFTVKDSHQKDALAAALYAYKRNEERLRRVEKALGNLNLWEYVDEVKDMILRGRCRNIAEAIDLVLSPKKRGAEKRVKAKPVTKADLEGIVNKLREALKDKERSLSILERYAGKLEERVRELEEENKRLAKRKSKKEVPKKFELRIKNLETELRKKAEAIRERNEVINTLKNLEKIRKEGFVPVKIVKNSSYEELLETEKKFGIWKDVLYFKEYEKITKKFIEKLKEMEVEVIIGNFPENAREKLKKEGIVVMGEGEAGIEILNGCGRMKFEKLKSAQKKGFIEWLKEYRKR